MKTLVHVNQHNIRHNTKGGTQLPVLTIKDYKQNRKANRADIVVDGKIVASIVYSPDKPLSCGARVWIETQHEVVASNLTPAEAPVCSVPDGYRPVT